MTLFLTKKLDFRKKILLDTFFSQFVLCLTSNNSTSQNIGGTDAWGTVPPVIPESTPMRAINVQLHHYME